MVRKQAIIMEWWWWVSGYFYPSLLCLWELPGRNTGVGSHFLLQGICLT